MREFSFILILLIISVPFYKAIAATVSVSGDCTTVTINHAGKGLINYTANFISSYNEASDTEAQRNIITNARAQVLTCLNP